MVYIEQMSGFTTVIFMIYIVVVFLFCFFQESLVPDQQMLPIANY